jgi:outer membrane protein assembly factor BamB
MRFTTHLAFAATLAVCQGLAGKTHAADWSQWRGPERNGISQERGLLQEWPEGGPPLAWRVDNIGSGYSTPAVVGDRLFLLGNEGLDNEFVQARSAGHGAPIWSQRIGSVGNPKQFPPYPGARSTPTVDGDRLFALGSDGDLVCLEAESGNVVWKKNLRSDFGGQPGVWAYSESPLVDGDRVICTPGGDEATLVALDKTNGETIWKAPIPGEQAAYASVVVAEVGGVKQYVQFLQKGLVGVDAAGGKLLWRYDRTATGSPANIPTPLVYEDYIYSAAGRSGGGLVKIQAEGGQFTPEEVYFEGNLPKSIGGVVRVGDFMYGTTGSALLCIELVSGQEKWQDRSIGAASVCYADGCLYLHGESGEVALVEATPEGYREKGRFTPPEQPDRGQSKAWAYPVVAGGKLYLFDFGTLWCYDVKAPGG